MEMEPVIDSIASAVRRNQSSSAKDYRDEEGLLVCGVCGARKEAKINFPSLNGGKGCVRVVPVICECDKARMDQEAEEKRRREEKKRMDALRKASLIDSKFDEARFENFEKNKENAINLKRCWRYATAFDEMLAKNQGLLLWGNVGTGKSFAAACIANYLLDKGVSVTMTSFVKLMSLCSSEQESDIINRLRRVKLVIFDDLGAERGTDYALERVYNIVDSRYRAGLPMILTTNLTLQEMKGETNLRYSRIYDRIFEVCYPMQFTGQSWRKKKAYSKFEEMRNLLDG